MTSGQSTHWVKKGGNMKAQDRRKHLLSYVLALADSRWTALLTGFIADASTAFLRSPSGLRGN